MKIYLIIISLFCIENCLSQSIENEWKKFNCENWIVKIDEEKSIFLGKEMQFYVSFINTKGNSKEVNYFVYKKSDIDSNFNKEVLNYYMIQSCIYINDKVGLESFYLNDYYYFLKPCHCNTRDNQDCGNLSKKIKKHITIK